MMVHVKQDMHGSWGCVLVLKGNTVWKKSLWLDLNPSLRLYQSNFLKSLPVSHLSLECWTTKMQRGVIGLCQLTAIMLWSAKCCIAASKDMGSTLPWCCMCCSLVPCLESLIVAADQGPCSGTVLGYDRTTTAPQQGRAELNSSMGSCWRAFQTEALRFSWGSNSVLSLLRLLHPSLTQVISQKHQAPTGCSAVLQNYTALEDKGRKGKYLAFSGILCSSSEVTKICGMPSYSHADGECK